VLIHHAERVVVCNVRGRDSMRNASDRIDADEMSQYSSPEESVRSSC
jgi:hypothetical protein